MVCRAPAESALAKGLETGSADHTHRSVKFWYCPKLPPLPARFGLLIQSVDCTAPIHSLECTDCVSDPLKGSPGLLVFKLSTWESRTVSVVPLGTVSLTELDVMKAFPTLIGQLQVSDARWSGPASCRSLLRESAIVRD